MDFTGAAAYLMSPEVRAKHFAEARNISIKGRDGKTNDVLFVPAGHWAIIEEAGSSELDDAAFTARFLHVPDDPKSFAMRGRTVRAVFEGAVVRIEGRADPVPVAEFVSEAVRVSPAGAPLCRTSAPMWKQAELLIAAGEAGSRHVDALRMRSRQLQASIIADPAVAADLHMLDAVLARRKDSISDGMAQIYRAKPASGVVDARDDEGNPGFVLERGSVREAVALGAGINPLLVVDLVHTDAYRMANFRAMARDNLTPYLGGRALEDVMMLPIPPGDATKPVRDAVRKWLGGGELLVEGPRIVMPEMPGYETSPVRHYRLDAGIDVLTYEDLFGFYVCSWKTPGDPKTVFGDSGEEEPPAPRLH